MIFSADLSNLIVQKLTETGTWSSILPFIAGIVIKVVGSYVYSEEQTRNKVQASAQINKEKIFDAIHHLISKSYSGAYLLGDDLRGDENAKPTKPDLIAECYEKVIVSFRKIERLESAKVRTKRAHSFIVISILIALLASLIGLIFEPWRFGVSILAILLIIGQLVVFFVLRNAKEQIEENE